MNWMAAGWRLTTERAESSYGLTVLLAPDGGAVGDLDLVSVRADGTLDQRGRCGKEFHGEDDASRDDVGAVWKGDRGKIGALAGKVAGSAEIFNFAGRKPSAGVNMLAVHDGFTLSDLVSYLDKHNDANGENNRDGHNNNHSCLLYTSPSPRDRTRSRMPSSA